MLIMTHKLSAPSEPHGWTFLSNHAHVLICIAKDPNIRLTEVAELVGIRERTVHRIVHELSEAGYLSVIKDGRNNTYEIDLTKPLRHPLEADHDIRAVVTPLLKKPRG
jgi:DNA-binding IclR family transcriptional regulator